MKNILKIIVKAMRMLSSHTATNRTEDYPAHKGKEDQTVDCRKNLQMPFCFDLQKAEENPFL